MALNFTYDDSEKKIYLICPVRNIEPKLKATLDRYVRRLESRGYNVHYPPRDADQSDPNGLEIIAAHRKAMLKADYAYLCFHPESTGSLFDFGMSFLGFKPVHLINRRRVKPTDHKSFANVFLKLDEFYRSQTSYA